MPFGVVVFQFNIFFSQLIVISSKEEETYSLHENFTRNWGNTHVLLWKGSSAKSLLVECTKFCPVIWEWMFLPTGEDLFQISGQNLTHWLYMGNINTMRVCGFLMPALQNIWWCVCVYGWKVKSALQIHTADLFLLRQNPEEWCVDLHRLLMNLFFLWSNPFVILHCKWIWRAAVHLYRHQCCLQGRKWPKP